MKCIWLIDATSYKKEIHEELREIKRDYFRIKSYVRGQRLGPHVLPVQRTFSMGLLRIATLLKRSGYMVRYWHLEEFPEQDMAEAGGDNPNLAAFGCVCPTIPICSRLAEKIKECYPEVITAVGGAHVNVALKKTMQKYPGFDRYAYGYEREAAERLVQEELSGDIEEGPYVDYSILPYALNEYDINLFTTLGCPFRCDYCQDGQMPYYEYEPDGGIGVFGKALKPRKLIHFFDSTLGYSESRLLEVCRVLSSLNHDFILSCDMRPEFVTKRTLAAMEEAGFREIRMGLETAEPKVLDRNGRKIHPDSVIKKIELARKYSDLYLTLYTISGLPGFTLETYERNKALYRYLLENRCVDEIKNAQYVPYPRDDVDFVKRGVFIKETNWENYDRQTYPVYETEDLSRQQIWEKFLDTARCINEAWLRGCGFHSMDELKHVELYPEYTISSYLEEKENI